MHYNLELLRERATDIRRALKLLNRYALMPKEDYLGDETVVSSAKYQLIVAAEAAQAICNHIVARVAERAPAGYSDCYLILDEQGIIAPDLARRLANMAKFRNLLVHRYGTVDEGRVYDIMRPTFRSLSGF